MRKSCRYALIFGALVGVAGLAGCGAVDAFEAAAPPSVCSPSGNWGDLSVDEGGAAIQAATQTVVLPAGVSLLVTQVVTSTEEEGMLEAVVRVCSEPLSDEQVAGIANAMATAIYAAPAKERLSDLYVSTYVPGAGGTERGGLSLKTESYQSYLWDAGDERIVRNWLVVGTDERYQGGFTSLIG